MCFNSIVFSSGKYSPGSNRLASINATVIAVIVVRIYILNVFPPILESLEVSLRLEIPETKETKIKGTATSFNILTKIVPNGIIQSVITFPIPPKTDTIPSTSPRTKPKIILLCNGINYILLCKYKSTKTFAAIDSTIGTALGTTHGSCLPFPLMVIFLFLSLILFWSFIIVDTGLKATLK